MKIIKTGAEINKIYNKKTEEINESKDEFFEKINKIDNHFLI